MRTRSTFASAVFGASLLIGHAYAQVPYPDRLKWWADARFGMFIHWGPVSLKETEISWSRANTNPKCPNQGPISAEEYDNLYKRFNPTQFNAKEWVRIAQKAGMKYIVLTAKHCDGFLLWNSKVSDYNIMHTPFKRDVCAELAKAAHEAGMRLGWYFSPMDWKDPDCRNAGNAAFVKRMQAEIRELLSNYGKIDLLWFDYDGRDAVWEPKSTYALVKKLQPKIVINNRLDLGPGKEAGSPLNIAPNADYFTPEQWIGSFNDQRPWESCMTMSQKAQWSWAGEADKSKPLNSILDMLTGCAGGDGNVLLDVGPKPDGRIGTPQLQRLKELGVWWSKFGNTIRGTRGGPYLPGEYGTSTRKGNTVFLHVHDWGTGVLHLPPFPAKVVRSRVLTGGTAKVSQSTSGITISLPASNRAPFDTIIALDLDRSALKLPPMQVPAAKSLSLGAKATASNVYQGQGEFGPDKAIDGKLDTRWATDNGTHQAWLEVDLGKPRAFDHVSIVQAYPELKRIRRFAIEYWTGDVWKVAFNGGDPGAKLVVSFPPVTAQKVRLNILNATEGPTIWEFKVFAPEAIK